MESLHMYSGMANNNMTDNGVTTNGMEADFVPYKHHDYNTKIFAGFWIRFCAYVVDLIVLGSFVRIIRGPLLLIAGTDRISFSYFDLTLAAFLMPVYFVLFTKLMDGQTPGKMIFGLKVVCFNEQKLSWQTVIIRELFGRYINKAIIFLYLISAFTPKKQHAIDYLVDTSVISLTYLDIWKDSGEPSP